MLFNIPTQYFHEAKRYMELPPALKNYMPASLPILWIQGVFWEKKRRAVWFASTWLSVTKFEQIIVKFQYFRKVVNFGLFDGNLDGTLRQGPFFENHDTCKCYCMKNFELRVWCNCAPKGTFYCIFINKLINLGRFSRKTFFALKIKERFPKQTCPSFLHCTILLLAYLSWKR